MGDGWFRRTFLFLRMTNATSKTVSAWFPTLPPLYRIGKLNLLHLPLTAVFCSVKCPGSAVLKAYDLAHMLLEKEIRGISGFHTPAKDKLELLLKWKGPVVICPERGLEGMRIVADIQSVLNAYSLLICTIACTSEKRITKESSTERNRLVACLFNENRLIYVHPGATNCSIYINRSSHQLMMGYKCV